MLTGKVKEYDANRGCGMITETSSGTEFVVYANSVNIKKGECLKAGQDVEFDSHNNRTETWAINVRILDNKSIREAI